MTPLYMRKHATRSIVGHSQRKHVCYSVIKLLQSGLVIHFSLLFLSLTTGMDFVPTSAPFPPLTLDYCQKSRLATISLPSVLDPGRWASPAEPNCSCYFGSGRWAARS